MSKVNVDPLQDYYGCYNLMEIPEDIRPIISEDEENQKDHGHENIINSHEPLISPPMDSAWPMYCHDTRHTGRSPYSTASNPGIEKWRIRTHGWAEGCPVIDNDGIIYIGASKLYAVYPNGTKKWEYDIPHKIVSAPAINDIGVLCVGTIHAWPNYLYAIHTSNGTLKWKYDLGDHDVYSSPAIGDDGTIYFSTNDGHTDGWTGSIRALNSDGSLKWRFKTNHVTYSSPAIGDDGTVFCGSHDTYLYALYPNNGTLKWKYKTGGWIRTAPCIGDDGTIYVVSLDNYLHALYPNNGTRKWRTNVGAGTSPTIGQDGTIYCGYSKLHAINPTDGSKKWSFNPGEDRRIRGGTPCNSIDGTIYFGTNIGETYGGEIIAVDSNGNEKWREVIADLWVESASAIGEDGTVYIGSTWNPSDGFLHAFGRLDSNAPFAPDIDGPTRGLPGIEYDYSFKAISPIGNNVYYWVDWGDNSKDGWIGPYKSGEKITLTHTWSTFNKFTIKARARDTDNRWGPWGELTVTMSRDKATNNILLRQIERFPLFPIIFLDFIGSLPSIFKR
jgi:outer membrane protein assembly factor BamB